MKNTIFIQPVKDFYTPILQDLMNQSQQQNEGIEGDIVRMGTLSGINLNRVVIIFKIVIMIKLF